MRCGMNEILDVELGGGLFWLALLVCGSWLAGMWGVGLMACGSQLAAVFGEGPRQNEEIRMWRGPVISGLAGNLRKDPARKRKIRSGGAQ